MESYPWVPNITAAGAVDREFGNICDFLLSKCVEKMSTICQNVSKCVKNVSTCVKNVSACVKNVSK